VTPRSSGRLHRALDRFAIVAGISPSRLMPVFETSVGVALRPYVRWLRAR
jgi:hypothetical protein